MLNAALIAAVVVGAFVFIWIVRREVNRSVADQVAASLRNAHQDFLTLAEQRLSTERAEHVGELETRKRDVEKSVAGLQEQLSKYEKLLRQFENDRSLKYGALEQQMTAAQNETQKLQQTTQQLSAMLGNAKMRGQWGEKTAEDILKLCGLREGIHYEKQRNAPLGRPDFTFKLPDGHACYMDVKFPLDNYKKFFNSEREEDIKAHKDQFLKDVRIHLRALEKRDYAQGTGGDPDFILMFIPNEQVYAAVNEWMPGLIDEALAKRISVCGPWTLYAQVRLMWQAWQSYYQTQEIGKIVTMIGEFLKAFQLCKERMGSLGEALEQASAKYREVTQTSFVQLERKIDRIEHYRLGQQLDAVVVEEPPVTGVIIKESAHA